MGSKIEEEEELPQCKERFGGVRCGGFENHGYRNRDGRGHWGWKGRLMVTWEKFSAREVGKGRTT